MARSIRSNMRHARNFEVDEHGKPVLKHKNYNPISDAGNDDLDSREGYEKNSTIGINTHFSKEFDVMS